MRNRTLILVIALVLCVVLTCSAFAAAKAPAKPAKAVKAAKFNQQAVLDKFWSSPDSAVVGTVNGIAITKGELLKTLWYWNAPSVLSDVMNQKMIEQAAKKAGVSLTASDLQAKVQDSIKRMGMKDVDSLLAQFKITQGRFISGTKISALAEKTVQKSIPITDQEYSELIKARHILIQFPASETDQAKKEAAAKTKIDEVALKIKNGEDFGKLANEYSEDPGNTQDGVKKGGDLGWFSRGRMVQEFENAAFALKAGEVSEPIKTFYGYHIIKVEKIGKDAAPAEKAELKKQILEKKIPAEIGKWFSDLQAKSKVNNKLSAPPVKEPTPVVKMQAAPRTAPAPRPAPKPSEPAASEKPATPPAPPAQ